MLCLVCSNLWVIQVWTYKEQITGPYARMLLETEPGYWESLDHQPTEE